MAPKVNVGDQVTVTAAPAEGYIFLPLLATPHKLPKKCPQMGGEMFKITKAAYGECRHICCSFAFGFCGTLAVRS